MMNEATWNVPPTGVGRAVTAMVTPFRPDSSLDLDGAAKLADHLVSNGTETVLVNGTTGESPTLHPDEVWELFRAVRDAVGDRGTVMVGTGANDTKKTIAATQRAEEEGADAVLVVTPYYNRPNQRMLVHHFRSVAQATSLPVVLYDVPGRTACTIDVPTYMQLAVVPNIVGVKDATGDIGKAGDILAATRGTDGGFVLWSGSDEMNLPLLAVGAVGVVSVSAHLVGPEIVAMIDALPNDLVRAQDLHVRCMRLHRSLFQETSPAPLKGALNALGLPAGPVRQPLLDALPETVTDVLAALEPIEALR
jgi:4-hydroxy-tetrahydrodipicolinate synthase